jgi:predicted transcriptional regulator
MRRTVATVLSELRALCPARRLAPWEARSVAERQAARLLRLQGIATPPVPEQLIEYLPRVRVRYVAARRLSGAVRWNRRHARWEVLVNRNATWGRQRFSLCHELKHVIDYPLAHAVYGPRHDHAAHQRAERAANYFATCLLMPKAWLKRCFYDEGLRDERLLRRRFQVSAQALAIRLDELQLQAPAEVVR